MLFGCVCSQIIKEGVIFETRAEKRYLEIRHSAALIGATRVATHCKSSIGSRNYVYDNLRSPPQCTPKSHFYRFLPKGSAGRTIARCLILLGTLISQTLGPSRGQ